MANTISENGINLIKQLEGFVGVSTPVNGVPHIGYGFNQLYHLQGQTTITRDAADYYLRSVLNSTYEPEVRNINAQLNQHQYDALVSFKYNVGHIPNALKTLLSNGDFAGAEQWIRTNYTSPGLTQRRNKEADYFAKGSKNWWWLLVLLTVAVGGTIYYRQNYMAK